MQTQPHITLGTITRNFFDVKVTAKTIRIKLKDYVTLTQELKDYAELVITQSTRKKIQINQIGKHAGVKLEKGIDEISVCIQATVPLMNNGRLYPDIE